MPATVEDLCPEDPDKTGPGLCGCGLSDEDTDGDGVICYDRCEGFDDGADHDGDEIPDGCDGDLFPCDDVDDCDDGLDCTEERCEDGLCRTSPWGKCDWPAEEPDDADNLSLLEPGFLSNLSGAAWNPLSQTLWVASNGGPARVWAVDLSDPDQPFIPEDGELRAEWGYEASFRDMEALTFVDVDETTVLFTLAEDDNTITRWDLSEFGAARRVIEWDVAELLPPPTGWVGAEGLTFVPDAFLEAQGFRDSQGELASSSRGLGGLMFVGHQSGGVIYALDLDPYVRSATLVGEYLTAGLEIAGLEFDRSTGLLFIWHGGSDLSLELARLSSSDGNGMRRLDPVRVYRGPGVPEGGSSNLEGFAIAGIEDCVDGKRSAFLTTDDGGLWSLLAYRDFPCD